MATSNIAYKIIKLSQQEYNTLSTAGTLIKDGVTYTYSPNDTIYVTPENEIYQAGANINISNGVISATVPTTTSELTNDSDYQTSQDVTDAIADNTYTKSETDTLLNAKADTSTTYTKTEVDTELATKQNELTAGDNIDITNDVISADDQVFIARQGGTSASDIITATKAGKTILIVDDPTDITKAVVADTVQINSATSVTIIGINKGTGANSQIVTYSISNTMWMVLPLEIATQGDINVAVNDKLDMLPQTGAGGAGRIVVNNEDGTIQASETTVDELKEMFRIKQWQDDTIDINIPSCTQDIANTSIPKMTYSITGQEGFDYQIVGMIAYEVFDSASGSNRINCWPVCQFTGNGQKELSVRWMCAGPNSKNAKKVSAWILLKHR